MKRMRSRKRVGECPGRSERRERERPRGQGLMHEISNQERFSTHCDGYDVVRGGGGGGARGVMATAGSEREIEREREREREIRVFEREKRKRE